jgi:hypothetical protein
MLRSKDIEKTGKEIIIEDPRKAQKEGLPQTRGAFFRNNNLGPFYHNTNGERSYSALGAIHHYLFHEDKNNI